MTLKAVAIDDEPIALEILQNLAGRVEFIQLAAVFTNAAKGIEFLAKNKVDLLFLDIRMPAISGTELMKSLKDPPMVIFTTAFSEHAVQSFELNAIDYLLKPFSEARFIKACNKALGHFQHQQLRAAASSPFRTIFLKSGYDQIRIDTADILYAESEGSYVNFITTGKKIISRMTMSEAEDLLPPPAFIRIHRSYIVAAAKVSRLTKNTVWLGDREFTVGASYADAVRVMEGRISAKD